MGIALCRGDPPILMKGNDLCDMQANFRELDREELRDIKRLAASECANYDREHGCLLLDGKCYMSYGVAFTCSALCKYYRKAVLPLDPKLEALLKGENVADYIRRCAVCGKELYSSGNRAKYCGTCARRVHRRQKNESDRKRRSKTDK